MRDAEQKSHTDSGGCDTLLREHRAAWTTTNRWNTRYIQHYRRRVKPIAQRLQSQGAMFTCEDFALALLISFASYYGLPIRIGNGASTTTRGMPSGSALYENVSDYGRRVMQRTGAVDLVRPGNTVGVGGERGSFANLRRALPGDVIHLQYSNGGHIQVVTDVSNDRITIVQGNLDSGAPLLPTASTPGSPVYVGVPLVEAYYDGDGAYHRQGGPSTTYSDLHGRVRRWNFESWNPGGQPAPTMARPGNRQRLRMLGRESG